MNAIIFNHDNYIQKRYSVHQQGSPLCTSATENGKYEGLVDSRLGDNYERNELARMVTCAAACVRHSARRRPKMSQV